MSDMIKIDRALLERIRDSLYGVSHIADARGEEAHAIGSYFPALLSQPAEQQEQVNEEVKVVAWLIGSPNWPGAKVYEQKQDWAYEQWGPITYTVDELMTVAQHQRIVEQMQSELNEARTSIAHLLIELDAVPKWISVEERLPDEDVPVLCYGEENGYSWNEISSQHNSFFIDGYHGVLPVTHWMPLPAPPVSLTDGGKAESALNHSERNLNMVHCNHGADKSCGRCK